MQAKNKKFLSGITGVYYTAAELSSRGYIVTVTPRNAEGIDMLIATPDGKKSFLIQVKTNSATGTHGFWLSGDIKESSPNLFFVFVNLTREGKPDFYIASSADVVRKLKRERAKSGKQGMWYFYVRDQTDKDRWDLLN